MPQGNAPKKINIEALKELLVQTNGNIKIQNGQVDITLTVPLEEILDMVIDLMGGQ